MSMSQAPDKVLVAAFSVKGEPVSKSRARFTKKGSKTFAYTPERTREAEEALAWAFRAAAPGHGIDATSAYGIEAKFFNGTRQRRDVDNMLKLVLDSLNKVAYADDNQVLEVAGRKILATKDVARTEVRIYRLGLVEQRIANCERCGREFNWFESQSKRRFCSLECWHELQREARLRTCQQCGSSFENVHSKAKYCSVECKSIAGRVNVICDVCGTSFSLQRSLAERSKDRMRFCSPKCRQEHVRPIRAAAARGICATCGGPTSKKSYTNCRRCAFPGVLGKPKVAAVTSDAP